MSRPQVKLPQGTVIGQILTDGLANPVNAFRGVPYALPPTGDRRFRPPAKVPANSEAIIDAGQYGPSAPGKPLFSNGPELKYSEDCLTANIFRRASGDQSEKTAQQGLPVVVYIHGGAFNRGTASMHNTASMTAISEPEHIAVSFNYRLGALGFISSEVAAREGAVNLGLKDQLLLLQWVQENIAAFGGDPERVTLMGLSAGAHSIGHLLFYFQDEVAPLFHRVIIESGAATSRAVRPHNAKIHEQQFRDLLREVGCPKDCPEQDIMPYLRSVDYEIICAAQTKVFDKYNPSLRWAFQPVVDGDIIPRAPLDSWLSGRWHKVPIMTGFTRNEGSLYVNHKMSTSDEFSAFFKLLIPLLDDAELKRLDGLYSDPAKALDSIYKETRDGVGPQYKRVEAAYANYAYQAPVRQTASFASKVGVPVYVYQWALEGSIIYGARHGDNMRYEVCDPSVMKISETQAELARTLNRFLANFIAHGFPNQNGDERAILPQWEAYSSEKPRAMVFGVQNKELVGGAPGPAAEMMDDSWAREESEFWWTLVRKSQQ